ncbi:MAG: cyclomaltodextrinase N-terminal domain-containing protein [Pyrinomonadaceae bacterium]
MKLLLSPFLFSIFFILICVSPAAGQAPQLLKVEPPSWWVGSTINPVRVLIKGRNLRGAQLQPVGQGLRIVGAPKISESGNYIFADVAIAPKALAGARRIRITTPAGSAEGSFEILASLNRTGRFQGFSPDDVMYLIMIDRFSDGDQSNNDPPQSRGIFESGQQVLLSRRRSSGRHRSFALPERPWRHRALADTVVRQLRSPQ